MPFAPIKENPDLVDPNDMFLSECPITLAANQKFNKMPVMLGFTHDEVLDFSGGTKKKYFDFNRNIIFNYYY